MNRKALIDLDTRVDNCDFGTHETRILNALQTIDVFTLRQLVRCEERKLTNIRFVGKVIIRSIQEFLEKYNLELHMTEHEVLLYEQQYRQQVYNLKKGSPSPEESMWHSLEFMTSQMLYTYMLAHNPNGESETELAEKSIQFARSFLEVYSRIVPPEKSVPAPE